MIDLTVISLFVILLLAYYTMGRNLSRPTILYVAGFFICSLVAWSWKDEWGLETMSPITACILIGGALLFYIVEWLDYMRSESYNMAKTNCTASEEFKPIKSWKLFMFLVFQDIAFFMMAKAKMNYSMTEDLVAAVGQINDESKFQNVFVQLPFIVGLSYNICIAAMPVWCVLLSYYINKLPKYKIQLILVFLNFVTLMVGTLLSGGRTSILNMIISFLSFLYISSQFRKKWAGGLFSKKVLASILFIISIFVYGFSELSLVIGRKETNLTLGMLLSGYCGAEIKNLDDYVQYPFEQGNENGHFAQYTLCGLYDRIDQRIHNSDYGRINYPELLFNNYDGYPLGNVYTTYYNFLLDFGYIGAIFLAGVMSAITSMFYRKTIKSDFWNNGKMNIWILFYGSYMPMACFLSYFSNKMFESITISGVIRNLVIWYLLILFFNGTFQNAIYFSDNKKLRSGNKELVD